MTAYTAPSVTTDDMDGVSIDRFFTFDDPLGLWRLDQAYAQKSVLRDGPAMTVSWADAGDVVDGLDTPFARDDFVRQVAGIVAEGFESGVTGWMPTSATFAQSTTKKYNGSASGLLTVTGSPAQAYVRSPDAAVVVGTSYKLVVWCYSPDGHSDLGCSIDWYTAAHAYISTSSATGTAVAANQWVSRTLTATAPATAAFAQVGPTLGTNPPTGEQLYVDDVLFDEEFNDWGTSTFGNVWTPSASGIFSYDGTYGHAVIGTANVTYYQTLSGISTNDFDIAAKVRATVFATTSRASVYLIARYQDDNGYLRFRIDFNSSQVLGWGIESRSGGVNTTLASGLEFTHTHDTTKWWWIRAQGNGSSLRVKVWQDGDTGPEIWLGSATDSVWNGLPGTVGVGFLVTGGPIPFNDFQIAKFLSGLSQVLRVNGVKTALSLSDNLPSGVTYTDNTGVVEASASLDGPIGTPADIYWSPFRDDQPWGDYPRDVAQVAVAAGAVTSDGYRVNRIFTGQMADIPIDDGSAAVKAISRTRLRLSQPIQPPPVHGFYEGAEATWAVGYALFKCGIYTAPPPVVGTRLYIPFNGSTRPYIPDADQAAIPAYLLNVNRMPALSTTVIERPTFIDGPFLGSAAPSVQLDAGTTRYVVSNSANIKYAPGEDFFSQTANRGRIECYVKATSTDRANSNDPTATFFVNIQMNNAAGTHIVQLSVDVTRKVSLAVNDGVTFVSYGLDTYLPNDNQWHLIGGTWDIGAGNIRVTVDNKVENFTGISAAVTNLPTIEDITQRLTFVSYLPIAELRIASGRFAPSNIAPHANNQTYQVGAVVRRSVLDFDGLAEPAPLEAWEFINRIARGELSMTGFDEYDRFLYLTMPYWVETANTIEQETLDTGNNLSRFRPERPVSRIFNQVLVSFRQALVEELWTPVFRISQPIEIAASTDTLVTVPLSPNPVELRTLSVSVVDGTALTSSPPSDVNATNYVSANTTIDGSGTYATTTQLIVTIDSWNPGSATVRFHNVSGTKFYVANNVNQPAFGLAGKVLRVSDATEFAESASSIALRGTRLLRADAPVIQSHVDALRLARLLVGELAEPSITFNARPWGDPRRKPGELVTVYDRDRTKVSGPYRLLGASSEFNDQDVEQSILGEQNYPVFVWGETAWSEGVWGPPA